MISFRGVAAASWRFQTECERVEEEDVVEEHEDEADHRCHCAGDSRHHHCSHCCNDPEEVIARYSFVCVMPVFIHKALTVHC